MNILKNCDKLLLAWRRDWLECRKGLDGFRYVLQREMQRCTQPNEDSPSRCRRTSQTRSNGHNPSVMTSSTVSFTGGYNHLQHTETSEAGPSDPVDFIDPRVLHTSRRPRCVADATSPRHFWWRSLEEEPDTISSDADTNTISWGTLNDAASGSSGSSTNYFDTAEWPSDPLLGGLQSPSDAQRDSPASRSSTEYFRTLRAEVLKGWIIMGQIVSKDFNVFAKLYVILAACLPRL